MLAIALGVNTGVGVDFLLYVWGDRTFVIGRLDVPFALALRWLTFTGDSSRRRFNLMPHYSKKNKQTK